MTRRHSRADVVAEADVVREMTIDQVRAMGGLLGAVASAKAAHDGFYGYRDSATGRKICIVLKA